MASWEIWFWLQVGGFYGSTTQYSHVAWEDILVIVNYAEYRSRKEHILEKKSTVVMNVNVNCPF